MLLRDSFMRRQDTILVLLFTLQYHRHKYYDTSSTSSFVCFVCLLLLLFLSFSRRVFCFLLLFVCLFVCLFAFCRGLRRTSAHVLHCLIKTSVHLRKYFVFWFLNLRRSQGKAEADSCALSAYRSRIDFCISNKFLIIIMVWRAHKTRFLLSFFFLFFPNVYPSWKLSRSNLISIAACSAGPIIVFCLNNNKNKKSLRTCACFVVSN